MAYYYKIKNSEIPLPGIQAYQMTRASSSNGPATKFDFSKHVLIELLDDFTPETKLWEALDLSNKTYVAQKRLMIDSHRIHCRRAIVVCTSAAEAKTLALRLSQTIIIKRCVCAVVVKELLSDLSLFEKQVFNFGDERAQQQLLYVTDLNRCREPHSLAAYLKERFSVFGTILSVFVSEDKDGYAHPEGVIKFAYLSEAYAAELAYDQLVVGMERLSVTTHHNILLTQCDLRVRLRETLQNSASLSEGHFSTLLNEQLSKKGDDCIVYDEQLDIEEVPLAKVEISCCTKNACSTLKNDTSVNNNYNISDRIVNNTSWSTSEKTKPVKEITSCSKNVIRSSAVSLQENISKINNCIKDNFMQKKPLKLSVISKDSKAQIFIDGEPTVNTVNCSTKMSRKKIHRLSCENTNLEMMLESISSDDCVRNTTQVSAESNSLKRQILSDKLSLRGQRLSKSESPVVRLRKLSSTEIEKWLNRVYASSAKQTSKVIPLDESGTDSPLRVWLKYELHHSSNNRVSGGCLEDSKKVVYATTKQDILVSVGCSHMTCGSCYPGSTNLLFGFR